MFDHSRLCSLSRGTVYRTISDALAERQGEAVDSLRFIEGHRLDALQAALGQGDIWDVKAAQ